MLYDSDETGNCYRKLSENCGEHPEESSRPVFLTVSPNKKPTSGLETPFLEPNFFFPILVGLRV